MDEATPALHAADASVGWRTADSHHVEYVRALERRRPCLQYGHAGSDRRSLSFAAFNVLGNAHQHEEDGACKYPTCHTDEVLVGRRPASVSTNIGQERTELV